MNDDQRNRGPWTHRFAIWVFGVALAVLVYWLLGFVLDDIGSIRGPFYPDIEKQFLDQGQVAQLAATEMQIAEMKRKIQDQRERQTILNDSTNNSQRTMNQLLEFQRQNIEKGVKPSAAEQQALAESQNIFLANQKRYQALNEDIGRLSEELRSLEDRRRGIESALEAQRPPARQEFEKLRRAHDIRIACLKMAVLIPLLLIALFVYLKKRGSLYVPLVYAFSLALAGRVLLVMHEYFPKEYFKYILVLVALAIVLRILLYLLRMMAFPKKEWLLKQYKEAYDKFRCPICDYPARRGPLKYASWSRRTVRKVGVTEALTGGENEETYTCPSCGSKVFEECESCHGVRHSLLPFCEKCGAEKRPVET